MQNNQKECFIVKIEKISHFALFPIQDPWVKLRFEVLFKNFHLRIILTTLFSDNNLIEKMSKI
jgi:hypothetical protein